MEVFTSGSTGDQIRVQLFCDLCNAKFPLNRAKKNGAIHNTNLAETQGNMQREDAGSSSPKINRTKGKMLIILLHACRLLRVNHMLKRLALSPEEL